MSRTEINFLDEKDKVLPQPKKKIPRLSKLLLYLLALFLVSTVAFGIGVISSGENLSQTFGNLSLWGQIKHLMGSDDKELAGAADDRINVLLLGMGGVGHDGPYLTDTIILASFKPSTKQVALVSVPRDLLVKIPGYGWRKVNNANAFGELNDSGQGAKLASEVISATFDLPIHYYVRIDFNGFVKLIDDLGGITVDVEHTLDDPFYPVKGKETATTTERYEHLYLEPGSHRFDGESALKYVRSRQARGIEGSDFARSQRQQKVLLAVKDKVLRFGTLANPYKVSRIMDTLSQHLSTNFKVWELMALFGMTKDVEAQNVTHRVFDDGPDGLVYAAIGDDGAFILKPRAGNFSEMSAVVRYIFDPAQLAAKQPLRVEIQNGTKINGLALRTSEYLESLGYEVIKLGNAPTQDYQKTVIYDVTASAPSTAAATRIGELLDAGVAPALPEWVTATSSQKVNSRTDILIILGQDRQDEL
ncbi:MAG: hypothetical protein A3J59_03260 [Candidatus Buchananbacteria bacterium RIFCSPHIGHO2_02_FULL_56_16]|uniref:Cell envelope-related transcriptional attenuator domain-containing protein n=1 Tax=Candidatus Buchananbacteria bacterium RIFCSPHIGHO2_02_FULL_56_16 TaxID=1797542 RepID=A0A1G1YEQ7_9BACT|nr:MAG: hypothetical protein A3J59_03260 [Candidatus Buchananbacteria bacterium RIFCSPHIGHO2_02_FULL_56_16]